MSLPTDVQEAPINEPAKRGPHLPQRGGVPTSGDRPGRGSDPARYRLIGLSSGGELPELFARAPCYPDRYDTGRTQTNGPPENPGRFTVGSY